MEDYGTVKVETVLDIMKVMSFEMKDGKVCLIHFCIQLIGVVIDCCALPCGSWSYWFCYLFISCT